VDESLMVTRRTGLPVLEGHARTALAAIALAAIALAGGDAAEAIDLTHEALAWLSTRSLRRYQRSI
jgi:hypothetical protein